MLRARLGACLRFRLRQKYVILHSGSFTMYIFLASGFGFSLENKLCLAIFICRKRSRGEGKGWGCCWEDWGALGADGHFAIVIIWSHCHTVSILLLAFGVSILILPQGNVTCYLEGVVMGRHKFRVSLNFVSSVSVVKSYLCEHVL